MAVPDFQTLMLPVLRIAGDGNAHSVGDVVDQVADAFQLSPEERAETVRTGGTRLAGRVWWAVTYLKKAGVLQAAGRGFFAITDAGRQVLSEAPPTLSVPWLEQRFPEFVSFTRGEGKDAGGETRAVYDEVIGEWDLRPGIEEQVRATVERYLPDQEVRKNALDFLASVIKIADEERRDAWYLRTSDRGMRLMAGRLLACELSRSTLRVAILGTLNDEAREALGSDVDGDSDSRNAKR